jgi:hypothetical protein
VLVKIKTKYRRQKREKRLCDREKERGRKEEGRKKEDERVGEKM